MGRRDGMEASASQPNAVGHPQSDHDEAESAEYAALVGRTVAEVERELILETLRRCHGNRTHAANILGISPARCATSCTNMQTKASRSRRRGARERLRGRPPPLKCPRTSQAI